MAKGKLFISMALAVVMSASAATAKEWTPFSDTDSSAAEVLSRLGIINGYEDGSFKPEGTVTRAEAAQMIAQTANRGYIDNTRSNMEAFADQYDEDPFTDISRDDWCCAAVITARAIGFIDGYDDGSFRPNDPVTEEQLIKMAVCACGYGELAGIEGYPKGYVKRAVMLGLCGGAEDKPATRAFAAETAFNMLSADAQVVDGWQMNSNGVMSPNFSALPFGVSRASRIAQLDGTILKAENGRAEIKAVKSYCVPERNVGYDEEAQENIWEPVLEEGKTYEMGCIYDDTAGKVGKTCRLYILYTEDDYSFDIACAIE